jgi:hypothetical protein
MNKAIARAIDEAGGIYAVAEAFEMTHEGVRIWQFRGTLPPSRVIALAELSGWKVTPHMLAPTLYPNKADGIPRRRRAA